MTRWINPNQLCEEQEQTSSTGALTALLLHAAFLMLAKDSICMGLPMWTFKSDFCSPEMQNLCHTQQRVRSSTSQISYEYANHCSYTILHLGWYRLSREGDDFITHYLLHIQHSAICSLMQSVNPMSPVPGKKIPLDQLVILAIKTLPFQIPFSPKCFGLDISYGRFPERWATAEHRRVHRSQYLFLS